MDRGRSLPLFGRDAEMAFLRAALFREGAASVLLDGTEGSGKSRLVQEVEAEARERGYLVLAAHCHASASPVTLLPLLEVLSRAEPLGSDWLDRLVAEVGPPAVEIHTSARGDPRLRFFREVASALRDLAQQHPVLFIVEDLHWADADSLLFFCHLLDVAGDVVPLLLSRRPEETERSALVNDIEARCRHLELHPLDDVAVRAILATIIGPLTTGEVEDLARFAEGNPLLAVELGRHVVASGMMDSMSPAAILSGGYPRRVRQLVEGRVKRLDEQTRKVLETAACFGMRFEPGLVARVARVAAESVLDALEIAQKAGLLTKEGHSARSRWCFSSHVVRAHFYEEQAPAEKRERHARIGDLLELPVEELAIHRALGFAAARRKEALETCREAALRLERVGAYESASIMWKHALSCVGQDSPALEAELLARAGYASRAAAAWADALTLLEEAFDIRKRLGHHEEACRLALTLGEMCRFRLQLQDAIAWLERARECCRGVSLPEMRTLALLGSALIAQDRLDEGLRRVRDALALAEEVGLTPDVAYWASFAFSVSGDPDAAAAMAERGLSVATESDATYASLLNGALAQIHLSRLDLESAAAHVEKLEALDDHDPVSQVRTLLCRALIESFAGRWSRVVAECDRWSAEVRLAGKFQVATARVIWAEAASALGDHAAAVEALTEALPDLEGMRPLASLHLARILSRQGEMRAASEIVARHALEFLNSPRSQFGRLFLGDLVDLIEDQETAERLYRLIAEEPRAVSSVYTPISVDRVRGKVAAALGRYAEAFASLERAIAGLDAAGGKWELALALMDLGRARRDRGRRGDALKAQAAEARAAAIFESLGTPVPVSVPSPRREPATARFGLSDRETEVLRLVAAGLRNHEIAERLSLSNRTVEGHVQRIFQKMDVRSRPQAVLAAASAGLLVAEDRG